MYLILLAAFFTSAQVNGYNFSANVITVYGDVYKDTEFFVRTLPWIIDNIGGEITVDFFMMGSGRYSVPQMCALQDLMWNTYLQAQYLKCEAQGNPSAYCLCETGVDPQKFKQCVATKGYLASLASHRFSLLGVDITPIIELAPQSTVFGVQDIWYLRKICTIFGNNLPRGCIKPFDCEHSDCFLDKKALAQFDRECHKEFPISCDDDQSVTTMAPDTTLVPTSPSPMTKTTLAPVIDPETISPWHTTNAWWNFKLN